MSDCDQIRARAAGLASLPAAHPERQSAFAHAATCAACAAALADGGRLLALLDGAPALPPPSASALARARAAVLQEFDRAPSAAPARLPARAAAATGRSTIVALVFAVLVVGALIEGAAHAAPTALLAAGLLGTVALLVAVGALSRGAWATGFGLLASGLFSLVVALQSPNAAGFASNPRCGLFDLGAMILPLGVALALALRRRSPHATATVAAAAVAGALAGQAALHLGCANHALTHLALFHSGAVGLAALVGAGSAKLLARAS